MKKFILTFVLFVLCYHFNVNAFAQQNQNPLESTLSQAKKILYSGMIDQKTYYLIYQDQKNPKWRVKIGQAGQEQELQHFFVLETDPKIESTFVRTEFGTFYFPSLWQRGQGFKATLNGVPLAQEFFFKK